MGKIIKFEETDWEVIGVGVERNGLTFCHLLELSGWHRPRQIGIWVNLATNEASTLSF